MGIFMSMEMEIQGVGKNGNGEVILGPYKNKKENGLTISMKKVNILLRYE